MKKYISIFLAIVMVFSMAACSGDQSSTPNVDVTAPTAEPTAEPTTEPTPEPTPEETPEPTPQVVLYRNPFNGEPMDEPNTSRPYAVMFNNHTDALPQCGVAEADIIFEVMAESITRMVAIFTDLEDVEDLGSIRSARPYFINIAEAFGAIYIHAGGSDEAYSLIKSTGIDHIDGVRGSYPMTVFYRNSDRSNVDLEHRLFAYTDKLLECVDHLGFETTVTEDYSSGLFFTENGTPADGQSASTISVTFGTYSGNYTNFTYDEESCVYTAYQKPQNQEYIDGYTKEAVGFTNVIVLQTTVKQIDSYGRVSVDLESGGEGIFACGGHAVDITWSRNEDGTFHFANTDGSDLELGVGKTYVCVISNYNGAVEME